MLPITARAMAVVWSAEVSAADVVGQNHQPPRMRMNAASLWTVVSDSTRLLEGD